MTVNTAAWKACITVLQVVSIVSTFVRLGHRWFTKRMWWDDWIAIIPLLGNIVYVVIMWLDLGGGVASNSLNVLFSPWFGTLLFYIIIWISRISLALSIARIFPPRHTCRRFAFGLAVLFVIIFIANVLMSTFDCYKSSSAWYNMAFQNCLNKQGAIVGVYATVVLDLLSDILLVASPLTMLWKIKLPRQQRRLVLALFSSSMLPLLASTIYCVIWGLSPRIGPDSLLILRIMSQLQAGISLLVCNLLVVTMLFYRIVRREIVPDPASERQPEPQTYLPATSTEKQLSETTRNTSTAHTQTQVEEISSITQSPSPRQPSPPPSLVLTSIYDDSVQLSSVHDSSVHESESTFSHDEENNISGSQPSWSFSDKSISSSIHSSPSLRS